MSDDANTQKAQMYWVKCEHLQTNDILDGVLSFDHNQ
jgi:hypothetical protein